MKLRAAIISVLAIFCLCNVSYAELWNRGGGLIYDDVLDVTWLQDAHYSNTIGEARTMNWVTALEWVDDLEYYDVVRDTIWDDWRLPQTLPLNGTNYIYTYSTAGDTDRGYNITAPGTVFSGSINSELAFMFYANLENSGRYDIDGNYMPAGTYGLLNTGPFVNLQDSSYFSGNIYETDIGDIPRAWQFNFDIGFQTSIRQNQDYYYVWAVRDGDVAAVPIPSAFFLLASGIFGIAGFRLRKNSCRNRNCA